MRRLGTSIILATTALVLTGCATMNVSSHVLKGADFTQYRTFEWGPADALPTGDPRLDRDPFLQDHVQGAIEKGLAGRGFARVSVGTADLLIHYHANISPRIDINRLDRERGYCYDDACGVRTVEKEAGTLVLDVIDARTNRLVWRGWAQDSFDGVINNQDRLADKVEESVRRILEQMPNAASLTPPPFDPYDRGL